MAASWNCSELSKLRHLQGDAMSERKTIAAPPAIAEQAHVERLLNAYMREAGHFRPLLHPEQQLPTELQAAVAREGGLGAFMLELPHSCVAIVGSIRWLSAMGHHKYGDSLWLVEGTGRAARHAPFSRLDDAAGLAAMIVAELALASGSRDASQEEAFLAQIASSLSNMSHFLEESGSGRIQLARTHGSGRIRLAEQSMLQGHPFHPAPKSSQGFTVDDKVRYAPELGAAFTLHYFAAEPELVQQQWIGDQARGEKGKPVTPEKVRLAALKLLPAARQHYVLMPVHPWQAEYLLRLPVVERLMEQGGLVHLGPLGNEVVPTSSVRTVWDVQSPYMIKLPLQVRITHFVRNNPTEQLVRTIEASRILAQLEQSSPFGETFHIILEEGYQTINLLEDVPSESLEAAISAAEAAELAASFGVVFRRNPAYMELGHEPEEAASPLVVAALLEEGAEPRSAPIRAFIQLAADARQAAPDLSFAQQWLEQYVEISLVPLIWLFAEHGVSMEAHVQNSLVALERGWPARFYVRDLEGTSLSEERHGQPASGRKTSNGARGNSSTGQTAFTLPQGHPALYADKQAWDRFKYYVLVNHFGHLIHAIAYSLDVEELALWQTVHYTLRRSSWLSRAEPYMTDLFHTPELPAKANLSSWFSQRGENPSYVTLPNPLYAVADRRDEPIAASVLKRVMSDKQEQSDQPYCAYLYHLAELRTHISRLTASLPDFCQLFYALKANSEAPIIGALAPYVHGFETASAGEIRKAREVDAAIPIIYGGPVKTDEALMEAMERKVRHIHVESRHELLRLNELAARRGKIMPVLLRVNVSIPLPDAKLVMAGRKSQFGNDEQQIPELLGLSRTLSHIKIDGFHFHSLSNNLSVDRHLELLAFYCRRAAEWTEQFHLNIAYINVGGGIGVNYADLLRQFEWERFTDGLREQIAPLCAAGVKLVFECGRYIVASCGYYAAEVAEVKNNHGSRFALLRGGTHHFRLPASWQHSHPFRIIAVDSWPYSFERPQLSDCRVTIAGELCTPKDVLARDSYIERVRVGDIVLFPYAGAYGWAISHHQFLSHSQPQHIYLE
ncbi:IucA/IucC family protein [Paenibacillus algorifonticola]|uniref:IucA/IucC family protein n=1 Tax=Paenibacillus algorifonticola TaxID=684063 RepID=UPI003D26E850